MSKFTKEQIDQYAKNLLIELTEEENEMVLKEFDIIEQNMEHIANMDNIANVDAMTHTLDDFVFTLREDKAEESPSIEDLLRNCKSYEDREVLIPRVVGENDE